MESTPEKKILESLAELLGAKKQADEMVSTVKVLLQHIKDIKDTNLKEFEAIHATLKDFQQRLKDENTGELSDIKQEVQRALKQQLGAIEAKLATIKDGTTPIKGVDYTDGKDADEEKIIETVLARIPKPVEIIPETPEETLARLKLTVDDIGGLKDLEKRLNTRISSIPRGTAPRSSNSPIFFDMSSQTNGVLKVFTCPKNLGGIVVGSDFPTVLMENNGFTMNASRTQITLTTDNAPSSGSQLVFIGKSLFNT